MTAKDVNVMPSNQDQGRSQAPDEQRALVCDCADTAGELLDILKQEKELLKRFDSKELMGLLPRKRFLVAELEQRLSTLQEAKERVGIMRSDPAITALKESLTRMQTLNQANRVFVQCSLDFWGDFLTIFYPSTYGPNPEASSRRLSQAPKGYTFSKEI